MAHAVTFWLSVYDDGSFILHTTDVPADDVHVALVSRIEICVRERHVSAISDDYQDSMIIPFKP